MQQFKLNKQKAIHSLLYVVSKLNKADKHKTYKILYFADRKHIKRYGRPIIGDAYVKMSFGPVPSFVKDVVDEKLDENLEIVTVYNNKYIKALMKFDIQFLSETDIECLDEAISENKELNFSELTNKSHDSAYQQTTWVLDYLQMAKAENSNNQTLEFIKQQIDNEKIILA